MAGQLDHILIIDVEPTCWQDAAGGYAPPGGRRRLERNIAAIPAAILRRARRVTDAPGLSTRLALLIAAPQPGETAMLRDQAAMVDGLLAHGFSADQILCLL